MGHSSEKTVRDNHTSTGYIVATCMSDRKHIAKKSVSEIQLKHDWGIVNDAHAGPGHRQVSFLSQEAIDSMVVKGVSITYGIFGENIVYAGIPMSAMTVGNIIRIGTCTIEITQIGKECNTPCSIYKEVGFCIMPEQGVFGRVLQSGCIVPGDVMEVIQCV